MLAYEKAGAGAPLLLIHGLGSCKEMWRPVVPLLASEREVVMLDLPGFGSSPPGPETIEGLADAVADFATGLGFDRPHVAGNSLGGGIALALAAGGRVASACAVSPVGFSNEREAVYVRALLAVTRVLSAASARAADVLTQPAALRAVVMSHVTARPWRLPPAEAAYWIRACAQAPSFWALLRSEPDWEPAPPKVPTTVAWGDHDRLLIHSRQASRARRTLPGARHVTLAGCGHVPTWDDPEQVAAVLLEASRA